MSKEIIIIRTPEKPESILSERGTSAWNLDPNRARRCEFVICTHDVHNFDQGNCGAGPEDHHAACLIGKILRIVPSMDPAKNSKSLKTLFAIQFCEFARVTIPRVWIGVRNPIRYMPPENLGIDFAKLEWQAPVSDAALAPVVESLPASMASIGPLTMAEAKKGLALTFNVPPEAIEITIRG